MSLPLIEHPLIRALLIVLKNDETTEFRKRRLYQAKEMLRRETEQILLKDELAALPDKQKKMTQDLTEKLRMERWVLENDLMGFQDEDKLFGNLQR